MKLTSFIEIPSVKARFNQDWPMPSPRPQSKHWLMVAAPISPRPQLIGTAFDYLLRFHLRRLNPSFPERENWVAEYAVSKLESSLRRSGQDICKTARARYQLFLDGARLDDGLIALSVQLSQLDFVSRCGQQPPSDKFEVFQEDIADLRQLVDVCDWTQWRASQRCRLNPTFGAASLMVGGADADFQIDDTLYELKPLNAAPRH